jgi:hypothetical protein
MPAGRAPAVVRVWRSGRTCGWEGGRLRPGQAEWGLGVAAGDLGMLREVGDGLEELPDRGGIGPVAGIVGDRSALVKSRVWRSRRSGSIPLLVMWMLVLM